MKNKLLMLSAVILAYACVLIHLIGIATEIIQGKTDRVSFFLHVITGILWIIISIRWTIEYRNKKKEAETDQ